MGYKTETVAQTIFRLNQNYFLPAIQREFVWPPEKVIQLFDSLMRGYPISSFLFWELRPENRGKWQVFKFVQDSREESHNEPANTDGVQQLTLVLDGQQRLTSMLIGLKGSYEIRRKYKKKNPWSTQRLYLDLLKDPRVEDEDDDRGVRYAFAFAEEQPPNDGGHFWIKVGRILDLVNDDALESLKTELEDSLPGNATKDQIRTLRFNIETLHRAIWKEQPVAYHTELDQDYDKVLDIFVRANDGGVKLDKSDLLLSTVVAEWGDMNAREVIFRFVDKLNRHLARKNSFDKDFVLKTCLVLTGLPVEYKVDNFKHSNLLLIRSKWEAICEAIEKGVQLVNSFGIDQDSLLSANALIPIIYYLDRHEQFTLGGTTPFDVRNAVAMRLWLTAALVRGVFSGQSDTALRVTRDVLSALGGSDDFPLAKLNEEMARRGRASTFDETAAEEILSLTYGKARTFLALKLLYKDDYWSSDSHEDHIFPQRLFTKKNMKEHGLSDEKQTRYLELRDRIANLQLLVPKENLEKSGHEFEKWISSRDTSFVDRHLIPVDKSLWKFENFERFAAAREELIRERLKLLFEPIPVKSGNGS